jgi:hypothetical protein
MSEEIKVEPTIEKKKIKNNNLYIGADFGTMTLQAARSDSDDIKIMRNVFLELKSDEISISDLSDISYVENDNNLYIVGEDAFRLANIFGKEVSRPMEKGLISNKEINAIDVLTIMIRDLLGDIKDKDVYVSYSIPAESIDEGRSVTYHEKVFGRILSAFGVNFRPINEAMAIIYSECADEKYSGVALSFGAGMCNCAVGYKGIETFKFSTARSGDWIDKNVAESLNIVKNRVTTIKEKHLNLHDGFQKEPNKKIRRVLESLTYFYENLVDYTIKKIINEFHENVDTEIDEKIPIVISGGTSLPEGFLELFKNTINKYELPFEISEIRRAKNPLTAVAQGLLIKTVSDFSTQTKK